MTTSVPRRAVLTGLALTFGLFPSSAWAGKAVTIDMRNGVTPETFNAYKHAVLGGETAAHTRVVRLLISRKTGFDAGWLEVPRHRRFMNIWVHIYVFHGSEITAPLRVNLFTLDSQSIKNINLEVAIR